MFWEFIIKEDHILPSSLHMQMSQPVGPVESPYGQAFTWGQITGSTLGQSSKNIEEMI